MRTVQEELQGIANRYPDSAITQILEFAPPNAGGDYCFWQDLSRVDPSNDKKAGSMNSSAMKITVNQKSYPYSSHKDVTKEDALNFLKNEGSEKLKNIVASIYRQEISMCGPNAVEYAFRFALYNLGKEFGGVAKIDGDRFVNIFEKDDKIYVDVNTTDLKILGKTSDKDFVYKKIPGQMFFRYELTEQKACLVDAAIDTNLLYQCLIRERINLEEPELIEAVKALNDSIANLESFCNTIPKSNTEDVKCAYELQNYLRSAVLNLSSASPLQAKELTEEIENKVNQKEIRNVFHRYPGGAKVLANVALACTVLGGLLILFKGAYTLCSKKKFDPLFFKSENKVYTDLKRSIGKLDSIVKDQEAPAPKKTTTHSPSPKV